MVDQLSIQTVGILLTGISLTVAATYYMLTLRNTQRNQEHQLETRQAQLFMNIYNQSFTNPQFLRAWRKVYEIEWTNYQEFIALYDSDDADEDFRFNYDYVGSFFEGVGVLVREDLLPIRLIALLMTGMTRLYWEKTQPIIAEWREEYDHARIWSEIEYLYKELMKYTEEHPELKT